MTFEDFSDCCMSFTNGNKPGEETDSGKDIIIHKVLVNYFAKSLIAVDRLDAYIVNDKRASLWQTYFGHQGASASVRGVVMHGLTHLRTFPRPDQNVIYLTSPPDPQYHPLQYPQNHQLHQYPRPEQEQLLERPLSQFHYQPFQTCLNEPTITPNPLNCETHPVYRDSSWMPIVSNFPTAISVTNSGTNNSVPDLFNWDCYPAETRFDCSKTPAGDHIPNEWALVDELITCASTSPNTTTITTTTCSTIVDWDHLNLDGKDSVIAVDSVEPWEPFDRDPNDRPDPDLTEIGTDNVCASLPEKTVESCPFESIQLIQECLKSESLVSPI